LLQQITKHVMFTPWLCPFPEQHLFILLDIMHIVEA
jgi:hypothetical protein